jgi:tRNA-dihydrouridine synthase
VNKPKPEIAQFHAKQPWNEQNKYYVREIRKVIDWLLEQEDLPERLRQPVKTLDDYTYYLNYDGMKYKKEKQ